MRRRLDVTQQECEVPQGHFLITTTDPRGVITYANQAFIDISGYREDGLIGKNHNIIRHPDMPEAAFRDLWQTIQTGQSWRGPVKNRCKNGDHYWVDAYVTPVMQNGQVVEYQSIRTPLSASVKQRADRLYSLWCQNKLPKSAVKADRDKTLVVFLSIFLLFFVYE